MTVRYARGKRALALCDNCNQRFLLSELKIQIVAGRATNLKNCPECLDQDHPQYFLGRIPINDPQALRNPRPDTSRLGSIELWGWNPVGNPAVYSSVELGVINITIDGIPSPITYSGEM